MPACCATLRTLAQANKVIAANQAGLLKALFKQLTGSLLLRHTGLQFAAIHTQATALKGKRFASTDDQNAFLEHWECNWSAKRIHGTERRQVQAMFEEERAHLKALPLLGMQYFSQETVGSSQQCTIPFWKGGFSTGAFQVIASKYPIHDG